jgi:hypothetical protein
MERFQAPFLFLISGEMRSYRRSHAIRLQSMSQDNFRRESGTQTILPGERNSANSFQYGAFASGLIAAYH